MAKQSPTSRSMAKLREMGFMFYNCEKWIPHIKRRLDAFNFGDILAVRPGMKTMLIQATSGDNHAIRRVKIINNVQAAMWLSCGNTIEIWSFAIRGAQGKRKQYELRREEITMDMMLVEPALTQPKRVEESL